MQVVSVDMEPQENSPEVWSNLKARTVSAAVLSVIALVCLWVGGVFFNAFIILTALLMMKEWNVLTLQQSPLLRLFGYPYVIIPGACLIWLRSINMPDTGLGFAAVLCLIAMISATDIGAYFIGTRFGRHKLAPAISPHKSWEGAAGGVGAAAIIGLLFSPYMHYPHSFFAFLWISCFVSAFAQVGDLFKSWIKRMAGVKNSGTILPGHGGLIDRLDGYMLAAPFFALIIYFSLGN